MNIRFDSASLRLRITKEECQALLAAGQLQEIMRLPHDHKMTVKILCDAADMIKCRHCNDVLELHVNKERLSQILRKSPTRDSLSGFYESLGKQIKIELEIDVKLKRS